MKLFELSAEIERILSQEVDRETGEITEETLSWLEQVEMERDAKALAVAAYLKGEDAEADAVQKVADGLLRRAERHRNRAKSLKAYLAKHCEIGKALADQNSEIRWRRSEAVEIEKESDLPEEFVRTVVKTMPDKASIRARLKLGKEVPGAKLVRRQNIQIR